MAIEIDTINKNGERVIWEKVSYERHALKHPELRNGNLHSRIIDTLGDPDCIYQSKNKKDRLCYYKLEYVVNNINWYTKVVVDNNSEPKCIKTAFRLNIIQESKYSRALWEK